METEASDSLEGAADTFRTERPRIADALKSFCTVLTARDISSGGDAPKQHELGHVLACARCVSKLINTYTPVPPPEWAVTHPQAPDEPGSDYLQRMLASKACYFLALQCQQTAGAKITKLLGRSYLQTAECFGSGGLRDIAAAELSAQRFPPRTVDAFLDSWASAINGEDAELAALVWAEDFPAALQAQRMARQAEVSDRCGRMGSTQSELQALREALHDAEGAAPQADARIVDVTPE